MPLLRDRLYFTPGILRNPNDSETLKKGFALAVIMEKRNGTLLTFYVEASIVAKVTIEL